MFKTQLTTPLSSEHQSFPGLSKSIFPGSSAKGFLLGNAGWHYHCPLSFILQSGWWCRPGCSWKPEGRREGWQHPLPPVSEARVVLRVSSDCAPGRGGRECSRWSPRRLHRVLSPCLCLPAGGGATQAESRRHHLGSYLGGRIPTPEREVSDQ